MGLSLEDFNEECRTIIRELGHRVNTKALANWLPELW